MEQKADRRARRRMPVTHVLGNRQHGFLPVEGLANDPREKARSGTVGLAGPHADRGQADADAVEEAAARIVGQQQLCHRLLRAVACQRRAEELVADRLGKRRAEHRDRRGEDDARLVAGADSADRLEELARAVQIDAVALLEIRLGLARDDGREMKNDARALGHELVRLALQRQIRGHRAHLERRAGRGLRRDDVVQRRVRDPACAQRTALRQLLKELAADHAGRADHEDPIHVNPVVCVIYLTAAPSPLADSGRLSFTGRP